MSFVPLAQRSSFSFCSFFALVMLARLMMRLAWLVSGLQVLLWCGLLRLLCWGVAWMMYVVAVVVVVGGGGGVVVLVVVVVVVMVFVVVLVVGIVLGVYGRCFSCG